MLAAHAEQAAILDQCDSAMKASIAEIDRLRAEIAVFRADLQAAAGELAVNVELALPGSLVRRLMLANGIMRAERSSAQREVASLRGQLEEAITDLAMQSEGDAREIRQLRARVAELECELEARENANIERSERE